MQTMMQVNIALFIWLILGSLSAAVIYRKKYRWYTGILIGLFLGPLSVLVAFFMPIRATQD